MLASSICTGACSRAGAWLQAQRTAAARQRRDMGPPSGEFPLADGAASVKCFDCPPWLLASELAVGEVVLDLEQARALVGVPGLGEKARAAQDEPLLPHAR